MGCGPVPAGRRDWAAAIAVYDRVLKVDPQNDSAYALHGAALSAQPDRKAIDDFSKAIQLRPGIWSHYRDRGRA